MKELQTKSDSVTTLGQWWSCVISKRLKQAKKNNWRIMKMSLLSALQVSTLSMQVGQLKRQVQDSTSETAVKGVFTFLMSGKALDERINVRRSEAHVQHFYFVHFSWPWNVYASWGVSVKHWNVYSSEVDVSLRPSSFLPSIVMHEVAIRWLKMLFSITVNVNR